MPGKKILFLCKENEIVRERKGYADAFHILGYQIICTGDIENLKAIIGGDEKEILGIIKPEASSSVQPIDLLEWSIPCATFEFDTYTRTSTRAKAARLFDFQFICHPGYEEIFRQKECSFPILLPWCVDQKLIQKTKPEIHKYDIGWAGRMDGKNYSQRRRIIKLLQGSYKINDTNQYYSWEEMIQLYMESKMVVNISRDDFLQDANMRCFEAMGAGSLLITKLPSELTNLGFEEGVHFVGFFSEEDLIQKIDYFLKNEKKRLQIATLARELVLSKHTYLNRAQRITEAFQQQSTFAQEKNEFRRALKQEIYKQIAFIYWKDGALEKLMNIFIQYQIRPSLENYVQIFRLFSRKLLRIIRI